MDLIFQKILPLPIISCIQRNGKAFLFLSIVFILSCNKEHVSYPPPTPVSKQPADIAVKWADMTLYTVRYSSFNSPTYASRSLGYLGLAMYESIVQWDSTHRSMNSQLNGLSLPQAEAGALYDPILCLNAAEDTLLKLLYPAPANSHRYVHEKIDSLYENIYDEFFLS